MKRRRLYVGELVYAPGGAPSRGSPVWDVGVVVRDVDRNGKAVGGLVVLFFDIEASTEEITRSGRMTSPIHHDPSEVNNNFLGRLERMADAELIAAAWRALRSSHKRTHLYKEHPCRRMGVTTHSRPFNPDVGPRGGL